jgi:hypothetical protein
VLAQITVRFGDSIIDVRQTATYRVGTSSNVDLAVPVGVASFPILGDGVVRSPIGVGTPIDQRLALGDVIVMELGRVTVTIEGVARSASVPLVRPDGRPWWFVATSLLVHLCVLGAAIGFGHLPRAKKPRPIALAHPVKIHLAPEPLPPPPAHTASAEAVARHATRTDRPRDTQLDTLASAAMAQTTEGDGGFSSQYRAYLKAVDTAIKDSLDHAGPLYREEDVQSFGGQIAFDPRQRKGWGTIATGQYKTVSTGVAVGDDYDLPERSEDADRLALCESPLCEVSGSLDKREVLYVIKQRAAELANCVGDKALELDVEIDAKGHVKRAHGHGKIARCAANVIGQLAFPASAGATHATYTVGYP